MTEEERDTVRKVAIRRYIAQQTMLAINAENSYNRTREEMEEQAVRRAESERELHDANKEYERTVRP